MEQNFYPQPENSSENDTEPSNQPSLQSFNHLLILGNDLPPKIENDFFGFDMEIQLSNHDTDIIEFLDSAVVLINMLRRKREVILTDIEIKFSTKLFENMIKEINVEVKEIIRGHRGLHGFTVRELGTGRQIIQQEERYTEERAKTGRVFGKRGKK